MKKAKITILTVIIMLILSLSSCDLIRLPGAERGDELAQTIVAIAFTETALANIQQPTIETPEPLPTETPPEPEVVIVEEEEVVEEEEQPLATATLEIIHKITPGNPGWINKWFYDTDSSSTASGGYVNAGDDYTANLYERPFTENDMVYRPDVDINKTEMSEDASFYYVTIYLNNTHPEGGLQAAYGVEIDEDRDGRGDLLVIVDRPTSSTWDITGVSVWKDGNNDVGGSRILRPDTNYAGNSYDVEVFSINKLDDPDIAWARVSTTNPVSVTLAFKKSLLSRDTFVWGVWAADSLLDPTLFDHHDHFTQTEAGSPYRNQSNYPLKALNLIDNTCRETYKFVATEPIPGLCTTPVQPTPTPTLTPTVEPTEEVTATSTVTPTEEPTEEPTGEINGVVFDDFNLNGVRDEGELLTEISFTIRLHSGACSEPVMSTSTGNQFGFGGLSPGNYCVSLATTSPIPLTTPAQINVNLPAGGSAYVEFGFWVIIN